MEHDDWSKYKQVSADATPHECYRHARSVGKVSAEQAVQMMREVFGMNVAQAQELSEEQERGLQALETARAQRASQ